jgi:hypothetical protein
VNYFFHSYLPYGALATVEAVQEAVEAIGGSMYDDASKSSFASVVSLHFQIAASIASIFRFPHHHQYIIIILAVSVKSLSFYER